MEFANISAVVGPWVGVVGFRAFAKGLPCWKRTEGRTPPEVGATGTGGADTAGAGGVTVLKGFADSKDVSEGDGWLLDGAGWALVAKAVSNSAEIIMQRLCNPVCGRLERIMADRLFGMIRFYFSLLGFPKKKQQRANGVMFLCA